MALQENRSSRPLQEKLNECDYDMFEKSAWVREFCLFCVTLDSIIMKTFII